MRNLDLKGANAVQLLGGVETYQRRYLYMAVLDIVEHDQFDGMPQNKPKESNKKPPASPFVDEVLKIVSSLSPDDKKAAGEIIKSHNNGAAAWRDITDPTVQRNILNALKEKYHD